MSNLMYQNYHKHSYYSNIRTSDSVASYKDYCIRALEYNQKIISSVEHGSQGRYIECYELAKQYDLKFLFGTEAYFVKDRTEKDKTNAHIVVLAKNENGRQCINEALSEANISGFYYQPRLDNELLFSLPKDDVWITTACIAGVWKYDDYEEIIKRIHGYFGDNFFLEVQAHNTVPQKNINSEILQLKQKYGIQLIAGVDSHYIDNDKAWERDDYLLSKGISYEDESGWYMDYPSPDELYSRFVEQGILDNSEIEEAFNNTNTFLNVAEYENEIFSDNLKMPSIYPDKTKDEKDKIFEDLIHQRWEEDKNEISQDKWDLYEKEIAMEVGVVKDINHSDYFLLDYEIVQDGLKHGGQITNTGRGSAVSFYINKLLGFTKVDRIASDVKLYPERFLSKTRILQTGSIADIDLNLGNPEVFAESQKRVLGENHAFPMIAYGTYKVKSAWKLFAKSQNVPFDIASEVTKQIEKYEVAIKHAETDDEREDIHVEDYIEEKYLDIFEKSKNYRGIISSVGAHPCAHLIYQKDIRRNIGLIMIKSGKNETLCSLMDGKWAEKYKFLKNDLLKVSVVSLIKALYQRIGIKEHTVSELLEICTPDHKVWDVYKNGWTMGINQVEQRGTSARCMKYRPKNISELCSFVAAIRPGFKSMYRRYENREDFAYNIKTIDDLIRTPQFPQSYMLYQEHAMAILNYAGIPMDLTYEVVKNIAKKRADKVLKYKETFLKGMKERIVEQEHQTEKEAKKIANMTWQIIEDSVRYSFNASHSLSVAIDSLYCAYLKVMYPLEFYETYIKVMTEENKKDKVILAQNEASSAFGIRFSPFKFGEDNRDIHANKKKNEITNSLQTVKHFSRKVAQALWGIRGKYDYFIDLLLKIKKDKVPINSRHLDILVKLDYFEEFGNQKELLRIIEIFNDLKCGESKSISKENIKDSFMIPLLEKYGNDKGVNGNVLKAYKINDCMSLLHECELYIKKCNLDDFSDCEKIKNKMEFLGYLMPTGKEQDRPKIYVSVIYPIHRRSDKKLCGHNLVGISIGSGKQSKYTIWSNVSKIKGKFKVGDILQCMGFKQNGQSFEMTDYVVVN